MIFESIIYKIRDMFVNKHVYKQCNKKNVLR